MDYGRWSPSGLLVRLAWSVSGSVFIAPARHASIVALFRQFFTTIPRWWAGFRLTPSRNRTSRGFRNELGIRNPMLPLQKRERNYLRRNDVLACIPVQLNNRN